MGLLPVERGALVLQLEKRSSMVLASGIYTYVFCVVMHMIARM